MNAGARRWRVGAIANDKLPDGLTVHGFGEDGNGEIYAMVTNTPPNGTGGIIYQFLAIPEPATAMIVLAALAMCGGIRRRR